MYVGSRWHAASSAAPPLPRTLAQPKMINQADGKGGKEIPIPGVVRVPTYQQDYLPCWRDQNTYIKDAGGAGARGPVRAARGIWAGLVFDQADAPTRRWRRRTGVQHRRVRSRHGG